MTNLNPAPHFGLVLDCADPERLAEFWAEALGYANVGSAGVYVALYPRESNGPKLLLQRVADVDDGGCLHGLTRRRACGRISHHGHSTATNSWSTRARSIRSDPHHRSDAIEVLSGIRHRHLGIRHGNEHLSDIHHRHAH